MCTKGSLIWEKMCLLVLGLLWILEICIVVGKGYAALSEGCSRGSEYI